MAFDCHEIKGLLAYLLTFCSHLRENNGKAEALWDWTAALQTSLSDCCPKSIL